MGAVWGRAGAQPGVKKPRAKKPTTATTTTASHIKSSTFMVFILSSGSDIRGLTILLCENSIEV
jgi:hypothetical protein